MARKGKSRSIDVMGPLPNFGARSNAMVNFSGSMAPLLSEARPIGYQDHDTPNPNQHPRKHGNVGGPMRYIE